MTEQSARWVISIMAMYGAWHLRHRLYLIGKEVARRVSE